MENSSLSGLQFNGIDAPGAWAVASADRFGAEVMTKELRTGYDWVKQANCLEAVGGGRHAFRESERRDGCGWRGRDANGRSGLTLCREAE